MRRPEFAMARSDALLMLSSAETFHLCGQNSQSQAVLKTLHGVVVDDRLCFHASPKGEKSSLLGQPVVANVEESIVRIPSYFLDAERACPATTLFRSVQVHGVLEPIEEPALKARALQALMQKLQPEGGHAPITHDDARYTAAVKGLIIAGVRLDQVDGKAKLAQNRTPAERASLLTHLWARGAPNDARAIELIRHANPRDDAPPFLIAPLGFDLRVWLPLTQAAAAATLLEHEYWNEGAFTHDELARAHAGSTAWVGATDSTGALVASARAVSDGAKFAWVYDVVVAPAARRKGLGKAVMKLLLAHPSVRTARRVLLGTRDAQPLYESFGFVPRASLAPRPWPTTEMVLVRPTPSRSALDNPPSA